MATKKRLLSGLQPSGQLHIGNYLGAMRQCVAVQNEYEEFISIVNYHALTTLHDKETLRHNTLNAAIDHLAAGLDPTQVTLFVQADVPQVTELTWILNTLVSVPYLSRAHAYKEKVAQGLEATAGLFDYPVLMASDILIVDAEVVPVGADQKQHVEITRDIAEKFNATYGETFTLPEPVTPEHAATVPGTDGKKMSKSYHNTIPLFADDEDIERAVMSIVTDSKATSEPKDPQTDTVFALHRHFSEGELPDLEKRYIDGSIGYHESKQILADNIKSFTAPLREKRKVIAADRSYVLRVLKEGGEKVRAYAETKIRNVRDTVGINL